MHEHRHLGGSRYRDHARGFSFGWITVGCKKNSSSRGRLWSCRDRRGMWEVRSGQMGRREGKHELEDASECGRYHRLVAAVLEMVERGGERLRNRRVGAIPNGWDRHLVGCTRRSARTGCSGAAHSKANVFQFILYVSNSAGGRRHGVQFSQACTPNKRTLQPWSPVGSKNEAGKR